MAFSPRTTRASSTPRSVGKLCYHTMRSIWTVISRMVPKVDICIQLGELRDIYPILGAVLIFNTGAAVRAS